MVFRRAARNVYGRNEVGGMGGVPIVRRRRHRQRWRRI